MFEKLRESLREAMKHASSSTDNREVVRLMREALVQAKVGLSDMGAAVETTRDRLAAERNALVTVQRRRQLAAGIKDAETVSIADQYERKHAERVGVLERKLAAQEGELALAEQEVAEMTSRLRAANLGISETGASPRTPPPDPDGGGKGSTDWLERDMDRAAQAVAAQKQLEELKRRMGK